MAETTQTITLKVGETFSLPPDATIIWISDSSVESSCGIPEFEDYACYQLSWSLNDDQGDSPNLEHQASQVYSITISGTEYLIETDTHAYYNNNGGNVGLENLFTSKMPEGVFVVDYVNTDTSGARVQHSLYFKTFPSLLSSIVMTIKGPGWPNDLQVRPLADSTCSSD